MSDSIRTITLKNIEVQENGIIRNSSGYLIGRLSSDMPFNSEHISGLAVTCDASHDTGLCTVHQRGKERPASQTQDDEGVFQTEYPLDDEKLIATIDALLEPHLQEFRAGHTDIVVGQLVAIIKQRDRKADRRTLETVAALLNGDPNEAGVVKGYVANKLRMYDDIQSAKEGESS